MASATRAWENQNWSSLTSTTTPASTSERSASMRSASDASVTTSNASNEADRPYTASASTTCRRPWARPASCWRTASSSDQGSSASSRSATIGRGPTTRISSSTTNGIPALRRCSASMKADDGWPPEATEIAAIIAPTSVRSSRSRRTCSTACRRSSRSTSSPPGWPRDRSFGRYVAMITRFGHGCWAMRSMRLALAASIQWRSSTTSTTGPLATAATDELEHRGSDVLVGAARADERGDRVERAAHRTGLGRDGHGRHPGWQRVDQLAHEARLADARLAGHEGDRGLVAGDDLGGVDDAGEAGERTSPTHHHGAHPHSTAHRARSAHTLDARSPSVGLPAAVRPGVRRPTGQATRWS